MKSLFARTPDFHEQQLLRRHTVNRKKRTGYSLDPGDNFFNWSFYKTLITLDEL
jgi:hypothetical protein